MTMGLPCDREGYDLRMTPCPKCGSRGCPELHRHGGKCSADKLAAVSQVEVQSVDAVSLAERLMQAAVDYESGRCSRRELSEARAAVEAAMSQSVPVAQASWMPIETAPKDRTRILLFQAGRGAFEGWWHTAWPHPEEYWMDDADSEPNPTHWRPTLAPPSADCGGGK